MLEPASKSSCMQEQQLCRVQFCMVVRFKSSRISKILESRIYKIAEKLAATKQNYKNKGEVEMLVISTDTRPYKTSIFR